MKKREKIRDKFFKRMWKRVKGLWNVLKADEPLPTSRQEEVGDEPAALSDEKGADDSEATESEED
ncbi:hypothetical protein KY284_020360 [Solanum tuberosum]|nr:hypothetical protein KY284_020360 [Solanum tuberosum]